MKSSKLPPTNTPALLTQNNTNASSSPTSTSTVVIPSASASEAISPTPTPTPSTPSENGITDTEGLPPVKIIIPALLVSISGMEPQSDTEAKAHGYISVVENTDGSITFTMTKAKQAEEMAGSQETMLEVINHLKSTSTSSDTPVKDFTYDKDYKNFTITMASSPSTPVSIMGGLAALSTKEIGTFDLFYKLYSGVKIEDIHITFTVLDYNTKTVIGTMEYPKFLESDYFS